MQTNFSSAAVARPHTHRAMSSSAAFSPYTDSLRRQVFDGQASNPIGLPSSIQEGSYPTAIGSARLDGQVVSPPPSGSSYGDHFDRTSRDRSTERTERQQLHHTLSGSMIPGLPAPQSPASERMRGHFNAGNASSTPVENSTSPFARSGLGFGGQLANSGGRPSFGITSSASATASTFANNSSHFDREGHRLYDGPPMGFQNGFLNVPLPGASTRSCSFSSGQKQSPPPLVSVMPSLTSVVSRGYYSNGSQQLGGQVQQNLNGEASHFAETFSDTSSPPSSPRIDSRTLRNGHGRDESQSRPPARPHSPPHVPPTDSRSRSQSLALSGLRPTLGSGLIPMPMSTISQHTETQNLHSPMGNVNGPTSPWGASTSPYGRDAFGSPGARRIHDQDVTPTNGPDVWQQQRQAERERDRRTHVDLANSLQAVLGDLQDQNAEDNQIHHVDNGSGGAYPNGNTHGNTNGTGNANGLDNGNGNSSGLNARSGASSRRHSVSVVAGPSARIRGFGLAGFGFSDVNNPNVVHRHGPVHQAERESIYPQPFGGLNGRFRAGDGDQPETATLGSKNLGGYTDDDLLAHGVNNHLNLRLEGDPMSSGASSSRTVPIGHGASAMAPPLNSYHSNGLAPGSNYGVSPSGRENFGRTPSQSSASPQYLNAQPHVHGTAPAPGSAGNQQVWSGSSDRFGNGNNLVSPGTQWPTSMHDTNGMSSIARDPSSFRAMAPGSSALDLMGQAGHRGTHAPTGGFVAAPGHPGNMSQGVTYANGYSHTAVPQQPSLRNHGPPFIQQRAPGPPMNMHGSFQPINVRGSPGMGNPRAPMSPYGMAMAGHPVSPSDPRFGAPYAATPPSVPQRHPSAQGNGYRNGFPAPTGQAFGSFVAPTAIGPGLSTNSDEYGKGVSLNCIAPDTKLYIVEFKAGRTDLFYAVDPRESYAEGNLVVVEADRGTDVGTVVNSTVSLAHVLDFVEARKEATAQVPSQFQQAQAMAQLGRLQTQLGGIQVGHTDPAETEAVRGLNKEILPKGILHQATADDCRHMDAIRVDEQRALELCRTKVAQRGLPMQVHAAEFQFDRRKLTFYFTAARRIDFRDLVKELFRIHKTRIWMACLGGSYLLTDESDGTHDAPNHHTRA